ncbi:MAG TPA: DUF6298 domain-containing protein, partial [Pirellulales bacterium]
MRFVHPGDLGKLVYQTNAQGDRMPDFSYSGYQGGGVALSDVPARVFVAPASSDNTARIQAAIDYISQLPLDEHGSRGTVLLKAGRYPISGTIFIRASGVVLRGQGAGADGTVLVATGTDRRSLIKIIGKADQAATDQTRRTVTEYAPVNATKLKLSRVDGLKVGDTIIVERPSTSEWIKSIGMDQIGAPKAAFHWMPGKENLNWDRVIKSIDSDTITLDAPITTSLDPKFGGGLVWPYRWHGRIENCGVENLRCESEYDHANPLDEQHAWQAITVESVQNAWIRQVTAAHFAGSMINILETCKSITVEDCKSTEPVSEIGGYRRNTFYNAGQMVLFQRCHAENGEHDFAVGYLAVGPNAFVDCDCQAAHDFSGPIESWASGVLYDNITMDGGGLALTNREIAVKGIGWAAANSVLWQCTAPIITNRMPPGAQNWAIGCWGQFIGDGNWRTLNEFVKPDSLYAQQLQDRLGAKTVANLKRREIDIKPGDAKSVDDLPAEFLTAANAKSGGDKQVAAKPLTLGNGWLTIDGKVITGGRAPTIWWNGFNNPSQAGDQGGAITRFVPGRDGAKFTDDLNQLTDNMANRGISGVEHNWALWYDRRRDDHQMIRRIDGDVWPPFYEQPWARSGQGAAWDGLSKYDLTKFNPWYFQRLNQVAGYCDQKGMVFLHDGYFQHNVLEAGAHWADFPWRPANCLQETGFPEPPPYTGGKRNFMAEYFYDVANPVRRQMHELYIRHYLDELSPHSNTVFLTGEEFSGPPEFAEFWVDTVGQWEKDTGKKVLLGISAPKNDQDRVLADEQRRGVVSVIDMKYWWYTAGGETYAPPGGKNLAPRQAYREWTGNKRFSPEQTARQIREYRLKYPDKAVLFAPYETSGWDPWAVLAGG